MWCDQRHILQQFAEIAASETPEQALCAITGISAGSGLANRLHNHGLNPPQNMAGEAKNFNHLGIWLAFNTRDTKCIRHTVINLRREGGQGVEELAGHTTI